MKKSYIVAALTVAVVSGLYLGQQQLSAQAVLPTRQYTPNEAAAGITLTANTHNFFSCEGESLRWPVVKSDTGNSRFWLYEFTGEEPPFTGNFYISSGEIAENPQLKPIDTLRAFKGGARYYAMSQHDLFFKCGEHIRITPRCGDGVQNGAEQCDDGNNRNGDGCSAQCNVESICGNGRLEEGEECDDSNRGNYDGCSETCAVEDGFTCQSEPSACEPMIPTLPGGSNEPDPDPNASDASFLSIAVDGPTAGAHATNEENVNLGNIRFETDNKAALIKNIFIAVQALNPENQDGGSIDVDSALEDVRLEGSQGRRVRGSKLTSSVDSGPSFGSEPGSFQIYRFINVAVARNEVWKFMANFTGTAVNGDAFRIHICGEPTNKQLGDKPDIIIINTTGCDFGGLIYESTAYQMQVTKPFAEEILGDVRPRGNIAGNFQTIGETQAGEVEGRVAMKEIGTADIATENEKDITLLRFEARAAGADLLLNTARFQAAQGSLNNALNYTLWVDTDGNGDVDTVLEDGVNSLSGQVTFSDLAGGGYAIAKDNTVVFEVHADVASTLTNNSLQITFAGGTSVPYEMERLDDGANLNGVEIDGECPAWVGACDMVLSTTDSIVWNFASQGSLFVTKDSTPIRNRQLLNGTLSDAVMRLEFRAENEDIDVTYLHFSPVNTMPVSIDRLELYLSGQSTKFAEATKGACNQGDTGFCADMESQQLVIPAGTDTDVIVRARMKSDEQGAKTNEAIQFEVSGDDAVTARGVSSANAFDASIDTPIISEKHVSVSAKITAITNANPDANGTAVPVSISPVGQFKFTAAAHNNSKNGDNDVAMDALVFDVNATNVVIDAASFAFYNKANPTATKSCTPHYLSGEPFTSANVSGSFRVVCKDIDLSTVDGEIDEGESATFVLEADISNPRLNSAGTSALQVSLQDFTDINGTFGVTGSHILWLDVDQLDGAEFHWVEYPETVIRSTEYQS